MDHLLHCQHRGRLYKIVPICLAIIAGLVVLTGCDSVGNARRTLDRARLIDDLASKLDRASKQTYTADYRLTGGIPTAVVQDQNPLRTAYLFPDGRYVTKPDSTVVCAPVNRCEIRPATSASAGVTAAALTAAGGTGFIAPTTVLGLLTTATFDNATVEQRDSTIVGQHSTCVKVTGATGSPAPDFDACITDDGVLGSFVGKVNGVPTDVLLTGYKRSADPAAFTSPPGAQVVDRRPT